MEKQYIKNGYNLIDENGNISFVSKETLEQALIDQKNFLLNIQNNISTLEEDLLQISNI